MLRDSQFIGTSAALVWQANPEFTALQVRTYLENAAIDDTEFRGLDNNYGYGILDLPLPDATTQDVLQMPTTTDEPSPEPSSTPEPVAAVATVTVDVASANLRTGPGTNYPTTGSVSSDTVLQVIARNDASDWFMIEEANGRTVWI